MSDIESEDWAYKQAVLVQRARALVSEFEVITETVRELRAALAAVQAGRSAEVVFLRHEECTASQCATCSACGMHVADDDETWRCLKCGPLSLREQP